VSEGESSQIALDEVAKKLQLHVEQQQEQQQQEEMNLSGPIHSNVSGFTVTSAAGGIAENASLAHSSFSHKIHHNLDAKGVWKIKNKKPNFNAKMNAKYCYLHKGHTVVILYYLLTGKIFGVTKGLHHFY
jgi:hypothetical protein